MVTEFARPLTLDRPRDFKSAPITGLTRNHWLDAADKLLDGVSNYSRPPHSHILLPGRTGSFGRSSDALEGFARTFLLLGFRVHQDGGADEHIERYRSGLLAGVKPKHPESWPAIESRRQTMVEAASIALGLYGSRAHIWNQFSAYEQAQVARWLAGVNDKDPWPNNQVLFPAVVNAFLKSVGAQYKSREIEVALKRIEGMYAGNGWYTDGGQHNFDYYTAWAFHFYPGLIARMTGDDERVALYRDRLSAFLSSYEHLFATNGAPVYYGRSLICRLAAVAPFFMTGILDAQGSDWGTMRAQASRTLEYFANSQMVTEHNTIVPGWTKPSLLVTQDYSGPASPYWLAKAFVGLLLPASHPLWSSNEVKPKPVESAANPPQLLSSHSRDRSVALLHPFGGIRDHYGDDAHYRKLAYTSVSAPNCVPWGTDASVQIRGVFGIRDSVRVGGEAIADHIAVDVLKTYVPLSRQRLRHFSRKHLPWLQHIRVVKVLEDHWVTWVINVNSREPRTTVMAGSLAIPHEQTDDISAQIKDFNGILSTERATHLFIAMNGWNELEISQDFEVNPMGKLSTHLVASSEQGMETKTYVVCWYIGTNASSATPPSSKTTDNGVKLEFESGTHITISIDSVNVTASRAVGTKS